MTLTRQMIEERIKEEILAGKTEDNYLICAGTICNDCEMFNEKGATCRTTTDNLYRKISRKIKLEKLLS